MTIGVGVVHSKNGGKTFETSQRAELRTCGCCDNGVTVDSKGTVYVAFRNEDAAGGKTTVRDSAVIRSYDKGVTWSEPVELGDDDWVFNGCPESGPRILADAEDRLHGLYWTGKEERPGIYYTVSEDGAKSFATPAIASHEGTVAMVWSDAGGLKFARLGAS
ncbi:MAG: sialidase family protein [Gaiellaceae bacterium]